MDRGNRTRVFSVESIIFCLYVLSLCYLKSFLKMVKTIISGIVVGLVLWIIQDYRKDVLLATYIISDAIEIPTSEGRPKYAQEIIVTNSGQSLVKDISIKIPRHVSTHKLTKHSNQVEEKIFSEPNSFELVYPELPSEQKISMLVSYEGDPLKKNWISISHSNGNAQAQENAAPETNYFLIWVAFILGMFTQIVGDIRQWKRERFGNSFWTNEKDILRNDKPWYASSSEWSDMQFQAINKLLNRYDLSSNIGEKFYYRLLNSQKPTLLSDEKWIALQKEASELFMAKISKEITRYIELGKLADFFKLGKPKALSVKSWSDFEESLVEVSIEKLLPKHIQEEGIVRILDPNNTILKSFPTEIVDKIRELAQKSYSNYLISYETLRENEPLELLKTAKFNLLTVEQSQFVKSYLLKFARMQNMPKSWDIHELELFVSGEKPEWMSQKEFDFLNEFVNQSKSLSNERDALHNERIEFESDKSKTENLKARVLSQLELIDRIITNPDTVEKIEDYDQTFASGNKRNLELIANLLKNKVA